MTDKITKHYWSVWISSIGIQRNEPLTINRTDLNRTDIQFIYNVNF